ncbi:MAG: cysteine methyltransferase [Cycloclasticus sp. Phe_18]|nr:MAG: cysteine methyltransferase [Cycloclasticus sp. Phe_18]
MPEDNKIKIQYYQSPVGELLIGSFKNQLCLCDWRHRQARQNIDKRIQSALKTTYLEANSTVINATIEQLDSYFRQQRKQFDLPLLMLGTHFQQQVWQALQTIPYGTSMSYQALANSIDNKKAVRAVANANAANAISIIIPCHRVIASNGKLTGYAGGLNTKKQLLLLEQGQTNNN